MSIIARVWNHLEPSDIVALVVLSTALPICATAWAAGASRLARTVWLLAIVAITVPFGDFHAHTHWGKVQWIPFAGRPQTLADMCANVVIYFPLGLIGPTGTTPQQTLWRTALLAAALSVAVEFTQVFSHSRFPSITDVCCNVIGAIAGAAVALVVNRRSSLLRT